LSYLLASTSSSYLGAFFRVAGSLITRLALMGGTNTTRAGTLLADPNAVKDNYACAASLSEAYFAALALQTSFTGPKLHIISISFRLQETLDQPLWRLPPL